MGMLVLIHQNCRNSVGERLQVALADGTSRRVVVKDVVHAALNLQGKDSGPSIQLWVQVA
jgi:hypothetical protein